VYNTHVGTAFSGGSVDEVCVDPGTPPSRPDPTRSDPEQWVDEHGDALFSFAVIQVPDRELAEDLVQETLLAALKARDRFDGRSSERTWLIGILKHKIADHFRRSGREEPMSDINAADPVWEQSFTSKGFWRVDLKRWAQRPDHAIQDREFWQILRDCLSRLPERIGQAFCLRELDGFPTERICQLLGVSATHLWTLMHRARVRLRTCLDRNWFGRKE
jgi:RNA polymerase sigma-70 factor (ECF subfamily)